MSSDSSARHLTQDPTLQLQMPGSVLLELNGPADRLFAEEFGGRDSSDGQYRGMDDVGGLLGGVTAPVTQFCSFELAYQSVLAGRQAPMITALRHYNNLREALNDRVYKLFLVHARRDGPGIAARLLPFPSTMYVQITELSNTFAPGDEDALMALPRGLRISVPNMLSPRAFTNEDLPGGVLQILKEAGAFYRRVYGYLACGHVPIDAWERASKEFPTISQYVPVALSSVFAVTRDVTSSHAMAALRSVWKHPLDAAVLTIFVFPMLLRCLRDDHEMRYVSMSSATDRNRYERLQIPLEDLEMEDCCLGWLPVDGEYRDLRSIVRSEM